MLRPNSTMNEFKRILVITGTPCVGKTSVSRVLSAKIGAIHIDLAELVEKERLFLGFDEVRGAFIADVRRLSKRVEEIVRHVEGDVVVDGHYAMHVVPPELIHKAFVLRMDPDELKRIMERRGYSSRKLQENLLAEVLDICLFEAANALGRGRVCEVDVTNKAVETVVEEIISILNGNAPCRIGTIDWLKKLESEGRLEEFLRP